jgi:hypothetical protein
MKESKILVLLVEPGKCPKIVQIEDALKAMQCIVGGDIEVYRPFDDDVAIVCNEEGKVKGFPLNRAIYSDRGELVDIIAGAFFVCYAPIDSEKFLSLPKELAEKYEEYFKEPESFNTEAGGVMVIRDTLGYPTYERFDGVGKYYIVKILSNEVSNYPIEAHVIAKIAGDPTKQAIVKDVAGHEWPKEQISAIWPIEDVYAPATLDEVYEILCEMDLGGRLTTEETIRNYVIDMVKAECTVAPLLESIENENAEYFYKDFNELSNIPAMPLYSAIDMIKSVI